MSALKPRCLGGRVNDAARALALLVGPLAAACSGDVLDRDDLVNADDGSGGGAGRAGSSGHDEASGGTAAGGSQPMRPGEEEQPDASTPAPDGKGDDGGGEEIPPLLPPEGLVAMFVAAGNGGRTVTSCDDGKTWVANHQYENSNQDHSAYTHKGFAFGNGWFVSLMGWGARSTLKISNDGVTWKRVEPFTNTLGTVAFDGQTFVVFGQSSSSFASDPSGVWTKGGGTRHSTHLRGGGGGGPPSGRGAVGGGGDGATPVTSWDGGKTWSAATGCPGMRFANLGQEGNAVFGAGVLLLVSDDGKTCRISDGGRKKEAGDLRGRVVGKATWLGDRFMIVSDTRAYFSADGTTWESKAFAPVGTKLRMVAKSSSGTYAAIGDASNIFYRSTDAITWTRVMGPSGPRLIDVQFGYGQPSALCPAQ